MTLECKRFESNGELLDNGEMFLYRQGNILTVIEPENETSWNRAFSNFNENRHKDGNLGLHDYEGHKIVIFFNSGKISISGT